jgi:hypothetical protein
MRVSPVTAGGGGTEARGCGPEPSRLIAAASLGPGVVERGAPAPAGIGGGGRRPVVVVFFARICSSSGTDDDAGVAGTGGGGVPWIVVRGDRRSAALAGELDPDTAGGLPSAGSGRGAGRPEGGGGGVFGVEGSSFDTRPRDDTATRCARTWPDTNGHPAPAPYDPSPVALRRYHVRISWIVANAAKLTMIMSGSAWSSSVVAPRRVEAGERRPRAALCSRNGAMGRRGDPTTTDARSRSTHPMAAPCRARERAPNL